MPARDEDDEGDRACRQKELGWFVGGIGIGLLAALLVLVVFHLSKTGTLPSTKSDQFKVRMPSPASVAATCEQAFLTPADKAQCKKAAALCMAVPKGSDPITGLQKTQACLAAVTKLSPASVGSALRASGHAKCLPTRAKAALENTYTSMNETLHKLPTLLDWTEQVSNNMPVCSQSPSRIHHADKLPHAPGAHSGPTMAAQSDAHVRYQVPGVDMGVF